jgi:hypothetical protein
MFCLDAYRGDQDARGLFWGHGNSTDSDLNQNHASRVLGFRSTHKFFHKRFFFCSQHGLPLCQNESCAVDAKKKVTKNAARTLGSGRSKAVLGPFPLPRDPNAKRFGALKNHVILPYDTPIISHLIM